MVDGRCPHTYQRLIDLGRTRGWDRVITRRFEGGLPIFTVIFIGVPWEPASFLRLSDAVALAARGSA